MGFSFLKKKKIIAIIIILITEQVTTICTHFLPSWCRRRLQRRNQWKFIEEPGCSISQRSHLKKKKKSQPFSHRAGLVFGRAWSHDWEGGRGQKQHLGMAAGNLWFGRTYEGNESLIKTPRADMGDERARSEGWTPNPGMGVGNQNAPSATTVYRCRSLGFLEVSRLWTVNTRGG